MKLRSLLITLLITLFITSTTMVRADAPQDFDVLKLNNGSLLVGVLLAEEAGYLKLECTGGTISMPAVNVDQVIRAKPGESMILLGKHLLQRKQFTRAEHWFNQAKIYKEWRSQCTPLLQEIEQQRKQIEEEKKKKEKAKIEDIIRTKGIEAGIAALRKQHENSDEAQYWGTMRGRLHILMALESLDHLKIKEAERHLALANQYGADQNEWNRVKDKLSDMKRMSALHGRDYLLSRFKKPQPQPPKYTGNLLAKVQQARTQGVKTPPVELIRYVERYAAHNELDPLLVWALIDVESSWRVKVVSNKGAQGLMQLMPGTAGDLEVSDPFNAEENIRGGTQYMRFLMKMFNDVDTALAAYNVGPGTVERSKSIPQAGQRYIKKVRTRYAALQKQFG